MFKSNFSFICDYAFISNGNKPNIIGIFRDISFPELPNNINRFMFIAEINVKVSGQYPIKIRVKDPMGKKLFEGNIDSIEVDIESNSDGKNVGIIFEFNNLSFKEFGQHKIQLKVNNDLIAETPLNIVSL